MYGEKTFNVETMTDRELTQLISMATKELSIREKLRGIQQFTDFNNLFLYLLKNRPIKLPYLPENVKNSAITSRVSEPIMNAIQSKQRPILYEGNYYIILLETDTNTGITWLHVEDYNPEVLCIEI